MSHKQSLVERVSDTAAGGALTAGITMNLADYNQIMEAATLTVGFIAGRVRCFLSYPPMAQRARQDEARSSPRMNENYAP